MNLKRWVGPVVLLAALVIGERIYLYRPDHKYRLTVEIETPDGVRSASGVMAVHPNRNYRGSGSGPSGPITKGDALAVDLGDGRLLVALLVHGTTPAETDDMNYLPLRALAATGKRISFRDVKHQTDTVPVTGTLIPTLVSFQNVGDPKSARHIDPAQMSEALGQGFGLRSVSLVVLPAGLWPFDFGGFTGEPVTRNIDKTLRWATDGASTAAALAVAGIVLPTPDGIAVEPVMAFRSK